MSDEEATVVANPDRIPTVQSSGDRRYQALLSRVVDTCMHASLDALKRYHHVGKLVAEFYAAQETTKYGSRTMAQLVEDLQDPIAELAQIKNVRRFLYWAKNCFDTYPDFADIEGLASRGFTISHGKLMFGLPSEVQQRVTEKMLTEEGRLVPSTELKDLIEMEKAAAANAKASEATEALVGEDDEDDEDDEIPPQAATTTATAVEAPVAGGGEGGANDEDGDSAGDTPAAATVGTDRPEGVPATGAPARERTIGSPKKVMGRFLKALTNVSESVPDACIVVREASKIGFNSDAAFASHVEQLREIRAAAAAMIEPVQALMEVIDEEISAAE